MKKILIPFCSVVLVLALSLEAKGLSKKELGEEILVKIDFQGQGVTTKNVNQKLGNISYKLFGGKVKINLRYQDETILKQLEALKVRNLTKVERDYQAILTRFGLEEDLEKMKRVGAPLAEITVLIHKEDYQMLQKKDFLVSPI